MSGTSADGADVAFVSFSVLRGSLSFRFRGFHSVPFPAGLRARVLRTGESPSVPKEELARLSMALGEFYALALTKALSALRIRPGDVAAAGVHGQTVGHWPGKGRGVSGSFGATLQLGEPSFIPQRTGIPAVSDFRPADLSAGGQGAPLAPAFHGALLKGRKRWCAFQNLGGIGNVTVAGPAGEVVAAFDTGPGNMLLDGAVALLTGGRKAMDRGGSLARRGVVSAPLLAGLVRSDRYLLVKPPKSTGRERYGEERLSEIVSRAKALRIPPADLLATLAAYTAESVRISLERFVLPRWPVRELFLGGGGSRNPVLVDAIARRLTDLAVLPAEELGVPAQHVEAAAFAYLAYLTLAGLPGNVPAATGGAPAVLGKISPAVGRGHSFNPWRGTLLQP